MTDNIKKQQRSFMGYNLIAFTLIFSLFGIILYVQMRQSLYNPVERALESSKENILASDNYVQKQLEFQQNMQNPDFQKKPGRENSNKDSAPNHGGDGPAQIPMRVQALIRSEDGEILNPGIMGRLYMENHLDKIPYDLQYDQAATIEIASSTYLSLLFQKETEQGETYYIQLISNLDAEKAILNYFVILLIVCIVVFVLLSISASYILSKKTMAPLIRSWKRQTEFVEDASHELRTPLTIIQNKMEAMLTHPQSTVMEQAAEIGVTLSETRRLAKLSADLMTLARADSNEVQLEKEPVKLDELIEKLSEPYQEMAQMQEKTMKLDLRFGGAISADSARIHQLMVILLDNALKYTGEGDCIDVYTYSRDHGVYLEVADTGIGIGDDSQNRIFDRFYRADKARTRESGGSGLGLSIAKWIVDTHGGTIIYEQNQPKGSIFRVRLKI